LLIITKPDSCGKWKSRRVEWNLYSVGNTKIHAKMNFRLDKLSQG